MHCGRKNKEYEYSLDGKALSKVAVEKDLGILISKDLKVSHQCLSAYNEANKVLGIINRTIAYKDKDVMRRLYKSIVRPHVEYCTAAWSLHYKKDKELIERIQHKFTKMIIDLNHLTIPYLNHTSNDYTNSIYGHLKIGESVPT